MVQFNNLIEKLNLTSKQAFNFFQHQAGIGCWIYLCDTKESWFSKEMAHLFQIKKNDSFSLELFFEKTHPDDLSIIKEIFENLDETKTYHFIHRIIDQKKVKWIEQRGKIYCGKDIPHPYIIGTVREITQLKKQQDKVSHISRDFSVITDYLTKTAHTTNLKSIVLNVKQAISECMDVAMVAVFLKKGNQMTKIMPETIPNHKTFLFENHGNSLAFLAMQTNQIQSRCIEQYSNMEYKEHFLQLGTKAVITFPIKVDQENMAALSIALKKDLPLNHEEYNFCKTLCEHLSSQISNALLFQELKTELTNRMRSESDMDIIFSETVDFICMLDEKGRFIRVNPSLAAKLGYEPHQLCGMPLEDLIHPDDREYSRYIFSSLPYQKVIRGFCNRIRCFDGEYAYLESSLNYVKQSQIAIVISRDASNQELIEKKNLELEKTIALEKVKDEFFSNLSHEFKTPLNIIISSIDLVKLKLDFEKDHSIPQEYKKFLDYALQNSYRMLRLTTNLIDTTKIESKSMDSIFAKYDLIKLISDTVLYTQPYVLERNISLNFSCDKKTAFVCCDAEKITRIILNLLSNAIKNTSSGGTIELNYCENDSHSIISVTDNGTGISSEALPQIFDKFKTEKSGLIRDHEGSGIGLYLVKSLVNLHGGDISVESNLGKGSCFTFTISKNLVSNSPQEDLYISNNYSLFGINHSLIKLEFSCL